MIDHATALVRVGKGEQGFDMAEMSLQLAEALHGERHDVTAYCVNQIGQLYLSSTSRHHHQEALKLYETWHDKFKRRFDEDDDDDMMANLPSEEQKDVEKRRRERERSEDKNRLKLLAGIAEAYIQLEEYEISLGICVDCYQQRRQVLGEDHDDTKQSRMRLSQLEEVLPEHSAVFDALFGPAEEREGEMMERDEATMTSYSDLEEEEESLTLSEYLARQNMSLTDDSDQEIASDSDSEVEEESESVSSTSNHHQQQQRS
jgi:hypothetical protein